MSKTRVAVNGYGVIGWPAADCRAVAAGMQEAAFAAAGTVICLAGGPTQVSAEGGS